MSAILASLLLLLASVHLCLGVIDMTGCGSTKGCMRSPTTCTGSSDCNMIATWMGAGTKVKFELEGTTSGWVALGFSKDNSMGDDSVVACGKMSSGIVQAFNLYTPGYAVQALGSASISAATGSYTNGVVTCSFERTVTGSGAKEFSLNVAYILFLGVGPMSGDTVNMHSANPDIETSLIDVTTDTSDVGSGPEKSPLVRTHGIFMVTAWTICVCTAVLLARYYKSAWPGKLLCDKKPVWFTIHRILNSAAFFLTVIAFIIIFVDVQGFTWDPDPFSKAHPILGIIVTLLVIVNPLMSFFRPAPDADKRWLFNWAHWGVGILAQILAVITMYFGMTLPDATSFTASWVKFVLVGFVCVYVIIVIVLEVHKYRLLQQEKKKVEEMEMSNPGGDAADKSETPGLRFRYIVLVVYLVAGSALYLTMFIALASG